MRVQGVGIRISVEGLNRDQTEDASRAVLFERDERYWYGDGWRNLRRNLIRLCLQESGDLLDALCSEEVQASDVVQAVHAFVEKVLEAIDERARATSNADIWHHSLRLFAMPEALGSGLKKQKKRFTATDRDHDPEAMLGATLKAHFETMRRYLQTEHSPHRLKVWEQIDRVSREIRGLNDDPSRMRSKEHLDSVMSALKERFPSSRNLPRSIATLEGYFFEFSRWHQPESLDSDLSQVIVNDEQATFDDLDLLEDATGIKPDPISCFEALPRDHAEAFAVAHRLTGDLLPELTPTFTSARAYYLGHGMSKRRFYRLLRDATRLLTTCLEHKIQRVP